MKSETLFYRDGRSDKVYQATINPQDDRFAVTFAFGRRGGPLQTGTKTSSPVDLPTAERIFDKLIQEKMAKGYTRSEDGTPYQGTDMANETSGVRPQLLNSIDEKEVVELLKNPAWCMQEKKDGRRLLVRRGAGIQGINRRGLYCTVPWPVVQELLKIEHSFLIDGEIVGYKFYVFDFLSCNGVDWAGRPYQDRLNGLEVLFAGRHLGFVTKIKTSYAEDEKLDRFQDFQTTEAEGVVFKLLSAPYSPGRPNSGGPALKCKFTSTASFIVSEINKGRSVSLKLFRQEKSCGNVTIPKNYSMPSPGAVVEVRYLYAFPNGSIFQPVYLGERDDIEPEACVLSQLKFKAEESDECEE
jgi:bifunctional non-homologous end joining protein LigD